jgi:hypothetical protein
MYLSFYNTDVNAWSNYELKRPLEILPVLVRTTMVVSLATKMMAVSFSPPALPGAASLFTTASRL